MTFNEGIRTNTSHSQQDTSVGPKHYWAGVADNGKLISTHDSARADDELLNRVLPGPSHTPGEVSSEEHPAGYRSALEVHTKKTLKYQPEFPERFGSLQDSRAFCQPFFDWYNNHHHHSGIGFHTPHSVHYGLAPAIQLARQQILLVAHLVHPERFVNKPPAPPLLPRAVWINPPELSGVSPGAAAPALH